MDAYMLFLAPEKAQRYVTLPHPASALQEDDSVILARLGMTGMTGARTAYIYRVVATNRSAGHITLERTSMLNHACSLSEVPLQDLSISIPGDLYLSAELFALVVQKMGGL